jgi:hypothetical protein
MILNKILIVESSNAFMGPPSLIQVSFYTYAVSYYSELYNPPSAPNTNYSRSFVHIDCFNDKKETVGYIKFYDRELIPPNLIIGSSPNYKPVINFHVSRFSDIIGLLRYEKPLILYMNQNTLEGAVVANSYEPIGEQEGV